ncbi:MAG: diguanylate cyclase [Deferribacteraceae bacterium]|jgi:diguanylate cyclase (GGDEF)-like protein|nr:diguanylate cyclase [Deferribacteraceae bacterium]
MDNKEKNAILIVDDEKLNLKTLIQILNAEYTIYTAKDGLTAIEMSIQLQPDVILLDIIMPDMDGYEIISMLKKQEKTKTIPVIFITGLSSLEDEEKGLTLGAVDYIIKPFSAAIVKLRIRNQIQIINQLRTIEYLSFIDQLTEIPNRRSFDSRMMLEWDRAFRSKEPITVFMIDVDKFKNYNDTYGHQEGDIALKTVADLASSALKRSTDFIARWGGEEFIILLPNTDEKGLNVAENIRENIEKASIVLPNHPNTKITVSIGVNTVIPTENVSISKFISGADEAMYNAKKTGRNKVCVFGKN